MSREHPLGPADRLDALGRPRIVEPGRPDSAPALDAPDRRLWFGILAPFVAWTLNELAGYVIADRSCVAGGGSLTTAGWIGLFTLNLLALAVAAGAGVVSHRVFREWSSQPLPRSEGWGRVEFMALAGVFISGLLLLNILYFGIMPFIVDPCLEVP